MFDIFIVVYEDDYPLLKILACSINKFCQDLPIKNIVVIENTNNINYNIQDIVSYFGIFSSVVKIINWQEIYNGNIKTNGYYRQQILKLISYKVCTAENIMILDSKNFFIKPVNRETFIQNEKLLAEEEPYNIVDINHIYFSQKKYAFDLFGISMENQGIPIITPFLIKRQTLEELENTVINNFNLEFDNFFEGIDYPPNTNEFYTMQAYIISKYKRLDEYYFFKKLIINGLWEEKLQEYLNSNMSLKTYLIPLYNNRKNPGIICSSVHRKSIIKMQNNLREELVDFFVELGICDKTIAQKVINDIANKQYI